MKICPKCGKVLSYNSYFGAYICDECKWENADYGIIKNKGIDTVILYEHLDQKNKQKKKELVLK